MLYMVHEMDGDWNVHGMVHGIHEREALLGRGVQGEVHEGRYTGT